MKRATACALGAALFLLLAAAALRNCSPTLPSPLRLEARFDAAVPGRSDPLVVTGAEGAADFLLVRFLSADRAVFAYDSWGLGGPVSAPVRLAPNTSHRLEITLPSLGRIEDRPNVQTGPLRVSCDGVVVLDGPVTFHWRRGGQITLAENPAGGTSCGPELHGTLRGPDGRVLRGGPRSIFSPRERMGAFFTDGLWRVWPLLLVAAGLVWGGGTLARFWRRAAPSAWPWASLAAGSVCLLAFAYCITDGSFRFLFPESFGSFYDYQALGYLHGHLDVPRVAVLDEAFIFQGRYYGYFGGTPAVLRLPFAVLDLGFGELSRSLMCLDFAACLVCAHLIFRRARRWLPGGDSRPPAWADFLFVAAVGLGSPLFFLSSRAYIYHEAILCGAAFALAGVDCTLRYLAEPDRRWWLGALVCGVLSTHARPTTGLFALTFTGCVAAAELIRRRPFRTAAGTAGGRGFGRHFLIGLGCVLGVFSFNAVSYLKFHTFDGAPLKYHVQYQTGRIKQIEGKNFHLVDLPFNLESYLLAPTFKFQPSFPFFLYTGRDAAGRRGIKTGLGPVDRALGLGGRLYVDMVEPVLGLPYAVPEWCLLAVAGIFFARRRNPEIRRPVLLLWLAAGPLALALFTAVATAERYTADFCPFLIAAGAFGLAALAAARHRAAVAAVAILTLWSAFAMVALTLHYEGTEVWGVPDEAKKNYQKLSQSVDRFLHLPDHDAP